MGDPDKGIWETTQAQHLVRDRPSGTFFARFRINGTLLWKTLETSDCLNRFGGVGRLVSFKGSQDPMLPFE